MHFGAFPGIFRASVHQVVHHIGRDAPEFQGLMHRVQCITNPDDTKPQDRTFMASIQQRGDQWFAQVRLKKGGTVVFSESKTFPTEAMARSWAERLEEKIKTQGPAAVAQTCRSPSACSAISPFVPMSTNTEGLASNSMPVAHTPAAMSAPTKAE